MNFIVTCSVTPEETRIIFLYLKKWILNENDLEEQFIRGWGKGGQKINKTSNCVALKHIPTGVLVKCQETRCRVQNRRIARDRLQEKLDELVGIETKSSRRRALKQKRLADRSRKSRKKYKALNEMKENEDPNELDEEDDGEWVATSTGFQWIRRTIDASEADVTETEADQEEQTTEKK